MTVRTRVGRSLTGDYDHFGLRVFRDLAGHTSYLGLVAFAVTGRRLSQADEAILDDLAVSSHVPEPRVWPIKLSRLGSSMGRAMPGFLCGSVALDCDLVGGRVAEHAADLLVALRAHLDYSTDDDAGIDTFLEHRDRLIGFGVPLRSVDERVVAFRACLERRGGHKQGMLLAISRATLACRETAPRSGGEYHRRDSSHLLGSWFQADGYRSVGGCAPPAHASSERCSRCI